MSAEAAFAIAVVASFAAGTLPFGLWVAKAVAGVDVRTVGSGNVGATNVSRVLGRKWFLVVFLLDAAKGALPVLLLPAAAGRPDDPWLRVACGMAAVLGHVFNPFLGCKGGKGVATGAGAIAALAPAAAAGGLVIFTITVALFRYVSLGSVCAAVSLPILALAFGSPREVVIFAVLAAAVIVLRHRANLGRIAAGTEPRVLARKEPSGG